MSFFPSQVSLTGQCVACGGETVFGVDAFLTAGGQELSFHVFECSHVKMGVIVGAIVAANNVPDPDEGEEEIDP